MPKGVYVRDRNKKPYGPKLTPEQDKEISRLYLEGKSQQEFARQFDCGHRQIQKSLLRTGTPTTGRKSMPMEKNPAWKGGRRIDSDGYVSIRIPGGYVLEHRLVMEKILGRPLGDKEVVHHKDGNKQNNHPGNLIVFRSNGEHLGVELLGKVPKWTEDGKSRILGRSIPSMKGTVQCPRGTGVRGLRKKKIHEFLLETSDLENSGPEARLELPPGYRKKDKD